MSERMQMDPEHTNRILHHPKDALRHAKKMLKRARADGDSVGVKAWKFEIEILTRRASND